MQQLTVTIRNRDRRNADIAARIIINALYNAGFGVVTVEAQEVTA